MSTVHRPDAANARKALMNQLAVERVLRRLTQTEVARQIGSSQSSLTAIERGHRPPLLDTVIAIADLYGLELILVVKGELEQVRLQAYGEGRDDEADALPMRYEAAA